MQDDRINITPDRKIRFRLKGIACGWLVIPGDRTFVPVMRQAGNLERELRRIRRLVEGQLQLCGMDDCIDGNPVPQIESQESARLAGCGDHPARRKQDRVVAMRRVRILLIDAAIRDGLEHAAAAIRPMGLIPEAVPR